MASEMHMCWTAVCVCGVRARPFGARSVYATEDTEFTEKGFVEPANVGLLRNSAGVKDIGR